MEYKYIFKNGSSNIHTPGITSLDEIKKEILHQSASRIVMKSTYPNGFVMTMEARAGVNELTCNRELIENPDGSFTAPTDKYPLL